MMSPHLSVEVRGQEGTWTCQSADCSAGNHLQSSAHYRLKLSALVLKERFYVLSDIKEGCWRTDVLLRLRATRAIHHVAECRTAPKELGTVPAIVRAGDAGFQLRICPGLVLPRCLRIPGKECKRASHSVRLLMSAQGSQGVQLVSVWKRIHSVS